MFYKASIVIVFLIISTQMRISGGGSSVLENFPQKLTPVQVGLEDAYAQDTNETQFKLYEDPSGRFSMEYPHDWTLFELEGGPDVAWNNANSTTSQDQDIIVDISIPIDKVPSNVTLRDAYDRLTILDKSSRGVTEASSPSFTNYTVAGNAAFSSIVRFAAEQITGNQIAEPYTLLEIGSIINDRLFVFQLRTGTDDFNDVLPLVERMIKSIRILDL